jgi:hypothetical protein
MLSAQEALMMQAAYDEQDRLQAQNTAGLLGAAGGGLMGAAAGTVPHKIGTAVNSLKDAAAASKGMTRGMGQTVKSAMRPGFRAAGGLTGAILGGALGAGMASIMKSESPAARLMGKLQAGGDIDEYDRMQLANELASIYNNPSKLGM